MMRVCDRCGNPAIDNIQQYTTKKPFAKTEEKGKLVAVYDVCSDCLNEYYATLETFFKKVIS